MDGVNYGGTKMNEKKNTSILKNTLSEFKSNQQPKHKIVLLYITFTVMGRQINKQKFSLPKLLTVQV